MTYGCPHCGHRVPGYTAQASTDCPNCKRSDVLRPLRKFEKPNGAGRKTTVRGDVSPPRRRGVKAAGVFSCMPGF